MLSKIKKTTLLISSLIFLFLFPLFHSKTEAITQTMTADIDSLFSFSLENGFYEDDIEIALSLNVPYYKNMQIHYTTDGSTPTSDSPVYRTPLTFPAGEVPEMITVKAIVCNRDFQTIGGPYTATYFVGKEIPNLGNALIVSITAEADDLFSAENGILYPMSDCGPTEEDWNWFKKQNCKQRGDDWIRNAHLDIFQADGSNIISQSIGLCVDGDHGSMTHYPYSLKVLADEKYDAKHPSFHSDIFTYYNQKGTIFPHLQNFNNMVFRNGGNEYNKGTKDPEQKGSMLRWNIGSRLADEAGFLTASSRPALIFLNGEFYSAAQLQDTYNRFNTSTRTLLNKDQLEIYKDQERACTKYGGYEDLYYSYPDISASPILQKENQEKLEEIVSLEDMFSYYAFQALLNNTDFPKKNYAIWRYNGETTDFPWSDGKFRFLINDLDCTYNFRYDDDLWTAYFHNIKEDGTLMGTAMQVEAYKAQFLNCLCDLMNSGLFDQEHLNTVIDEANFYFGLIAKYAYSAEDEAQRQQNVQYLKESAFARKDLIKTLIQETFQPKYPYTLNVKAPKAGTSIRFSTTTLSCTDEDFSGSYYGDYSMQLSAELSNNQRFLYWKINDQKIPMQKLYLNETFIQNGKIQVELITETIPSDSPLQISEICASADNSWIELYNASDSAINLSEYRLSNDLPARHIKFTLPDHTLSPGEVFLVFIDNTGLFRIECGKPVYLCKDAFIVDALTVPVMSSTESYARYSETTNWRYYVNPTPGAVN